MSTTPTIDLRHVARGINIPLRQVQAVVELLDEGNTVPFITRYRKDQTGGLDEEQIRLVQGRLTKMRLLADRKQTILRSIEAQGKLTEELAQLIHAAGTTKRLEDLYLPFKPHKQTLATRPVRAGWKTSPARFSRPIRCVPTSTPAPATSPTPTARCPPAADALLGAGHILAEQFSERADLRQALREILQRTGKFISVASPEIKEKVGGGGRGQKGGGRRRRETGERGREKGEGRRQTGEERRYSEGSCGRGRRRCCAGGERSAAGRAGRRTRVAAGGRCACRPAGPGRSARFAGRPARSAGRSAPVDVVARPRKRWPAMSPSSDPPSAETPAPAAEATVEPTSASAEAAIVDAVDTAAAPSSDAPTAEPAIETSSPSDCGNAGRGRACCAGGRGVCRTAAAACRGPPGEKEEARPGQAQQEGIEEEARRRAADQGLPRLLRLQRGDQEDPAAPRAGHQPRRAGEGACA